MLAEAEEQNDLQFAEIARLSCEVTELKARCETMHRRAQKAEGRTERILSAIRWVRRVQRTTKDGMTDPTGFWRSRKAEEGWGADVRAEARELRRRIVKLEAQNAELARQNEQLIQTADWWNSHIKAALDRHGMGDCFHDCDTVDWLCDEIGGLREELARSIPAAHVKAKVSELESSNAELTRQNSLALAAFDGNNPEAVRILQVNLNRHLSPLQRYQVARDILDADGVAAVAREHGYILAAHVDHITPDAPLPSSEQMAAWLEANGWSRAGTGGCFFNDTSSVEVPVFAPKEQYRAQVRVCIGKISRRQGRQCGEIYLEMMAMPKGGDDS